MRLIISSDDSTAKHKDNTPYDFRADLPRPICLEGDWAISLTEVTLQNNPSEAQGLLICTNLCTDTIIGERELPLLRRVYTDSTNTYSFSHIHEIPVRLKQFQMVHVYIRTDTNAPASLVTGRVTLTLELKRKAYLEE